MGYVTPEQITQAKELDLLTYLQRYDPHELVHVGGNTYCTREHDSLKISNGKWNWFSRGIGGKTALDYLIKVQGFLFTLATGARSPKPSPWRRVKQEQTSASRKSYPVKNGIKKPPRLGRPRGAALYMICSSAQLSTTRTPISSRVATGNRAMLSASNFGQSRFSGSIRRSLPPAG